FSVALMVYFFFSSRRRHTRFSRDWSSDVCSSDLQWAPCRIKKRSSEFLGKFRTPLHSSALSPLRSWRVGAESGNISPYETPSKCIITDLQLPVSNGKASGDRNCDDSRIYG